MTILFWPRKPRKPRPSPKPRKPRRRWPKLPAKVGKARQMLNAAITNRHLGSTPPLSEGSWSASQLRPASYGNDSTT